MTHTHCVYPGRRAVFAVSTKQLVLTLEATLND